MIARLVCAALIAPAAVVVAAPTAAADPSSAGSQSGSVVFAESLGDAAKRVGEERSGAPLARVDIANAQFTQTEGLITLAVQVRSLESATVDRLSVNLDTDGDARPDHALRWRAGAGLTFGEVDDRFKGAVAPIDCDRAGVLAEPAGNLITVVIDRDCLVGGDSTRVHHLQVSVLDRIGLPGRHGELVGAKWDFLGGSATMVTVPF